LASGGNASTASLLEADKKGQEIQGKKAEMKQRLSPDTKFTITGE